MIDPELKVVLGEIPGRAPVPGSDDDVDEDQIDLGPLRKDSAGGPQDLVVSGLGFGARRRDLPGADKGRRGENTDQEAPSFAGLVGRALRGGQALGVFLQALDAEDLGADRLFHLRRSCDDGGGGLHFKSRPYQNPAYSMMFCRFPGPSTGVGQRLERPVMMASTDSTLRTVLMAEPCGKCAAAPGVTR
jgi:hypothetical protein